MSAWNPAVLDEMALPPCHILCQFYVNQKENTLSCQLYQRSGDMFLGVPFNIASYAFLTYNLCKLTGYKPGKFYHILGDAHIYEEHLEVLKKQLNSKTHDFPKINIVKKYESIDNYKLDDINQAVKTLRDGKSSRIIIKM